MVERPVYVHSAPVAQDGRLVIAGTLLLLINVILWYEVHTPIAQGQLSPRMTMLMNILHILLIVIGVALIVRGSWG